MEPITRAEYFSKVDSLHLPTLIAVEHDLPNGIQCNWFVSTTYRPNREETFWVWCTNNLKGYIRQYPPIHDTEAWWGFTDKQDVVWWLLKWSEYV